MGLHFPQKKQHKNHPNPKLCKPVAHAYPTSSLNFHALADGAVLASVPL